MKCPEGFCRDAEHCMQGGRCEDAVGELTPLVTQAMAPEERDRVNRYIAAELLAWADKCDQRAGPGFDPKSWAVACTRASFKQIATDLRTRAFKLSTGATP